MLTRKQSSDSDNEMQIRRVLVVGAGNMGQQISLQCAAHGYDAVLYDNDAAVLSRAKGKIRGHAEGLVEAGELDSDEVPAILTRIRLSDAPEEAGKDIDLLSESVTEDPQVKGRVFSVFDRVCPPHAIFTTNTSSLLPSQYASATGRPARFAAFHFHNPVWHANVVDVMPHAGTAPDVVDVLEDFARGIGQIPIRIHKESAGYIFNSMLGGIINSALELAANDVASVQDIDRAWMGITKMGAGPFGIMDTIGIDLIYHIIKRSTRWTFFLPQVRRLLNFLEPYVERGWLGCKSGRGFYAYPHPEFKTPGFAEGGARGGE